MSRSRDAGAAPGDQTTVQALRRRHPDEIAWIVGKGPSLALLSREHIGPGPVIAINEAILAVEALDVANPLYSMQKDADEYRLGEGGEGWFVQMRGATAPVAPLRRAALLVHLHESPDRMPAYCPRYVFDNVADFGLEWWEISAVVAAAVARLMGCARVVYVSHDACVGSDIRECIPKPDGTFEIRSADAPFSADYLEHRRRIDEYVSRVSLPADWLTPAPPAATAALRAERDQARLDIESLDRQLASERASRQAERDQAREHAQSLERQLASERARSAALLSSASWRWMGPLRAVKRMLMRLGS